MSHTVEVFVDEYGDRGFGPRASRHFAMTALLVPQEHLRHLRAVTIGLRGVINTDKPLHWVEHFTPKPKHAWRRELAADLLRGIPQAQLIFVLADKDSLTASEALKNDKDRFYNYITRLLLERVEYSVRAWPGERYARVRLGAVKNQDHAGSLAYLTSLRTMGCFPHLHWPVKWHGPGEYDGLQMADLAMGMFSTAFKGDVNDHACAAHLLKQKALLARSPSGSHLGYSIKVFGDDVLLTDRAWWPDL